MRLKKPKLPSVKLNRTAVIALVMAVGLIAAFSTFAAGPGKKNNNGKNNQKPPTAQQQPNKQGKANDAKKPAAKQTKWESDGAAATSCKPGPKNQKCEVSPSDHAMRSGYNHEISWKTGEMEAGNYRLALYYRNFGALPPANPYQYHVTISVNGKKASEERLTASKQLQRFASRDLNLKNGVNTISIKWDNDQAGNGRDANLAWRSISVTQQKNQPGDVEKSKIDQYNAQEILEQVKKGRVSFPYQSSTGDSKVVLEKLSAGQDAPVTCSNAGRSSTTMNPKVLAYVLEVSEKTPVGINAITDKCHTVGSNHYSGEALDLDLGVGDIGQLVNQAKDFGGARNSETSHIHFDFLK